MKLSDFDYPVSPEQIALYPLAKRDSSKLFVVHRDTSIFEHKTFVDITDYFQTGDVVVLNNTKVIPARIYGTKPSGGKVEIMLLRELGRNNWEALVRGTKEGSVMVSNEITAHVSRGNDSPAKVNFEGNGVDFDITTLLDKVGVMPLPPYIKRKAERSDNEKYQTVYAEKKGAIAAPTAGLHFTEYVLNAIRKKGATIATVTLHVGYGTFKPVTSDNIHAHTMDEEFYEIPEAAASAINSAKSEGRRVIAIGTTVTRTLESAVYPITPGAGWTNIFIRPGYAFRIIDALITNFHQPKSTPMMLASAFTGLDVLKKAYAEAQQKGYRFFSYGDTMLIL
ncbi:MAG: tRNA preQ1(34) S-adenosylmethionine ribosyltransferase-isomerase QueA [Nitrospiraceae bacterium]|nr:MAG: tRNA preQ1(34) S-adenosylmethionine ribosyltransferase-isomerase QueA [Nitrospiraceae bacterium]